MIDEPLRLHLVAETLVMDFSDTGNRGYGRVHRGAVARLLALTECGAPPDPGVASGQAD